MWDFLKGNKTIKAEKKEQEAREQAEREAKEAREKAEREARERMHQRVVSFKKKIALGVGIVAFLMIGISSNFPSREGSMVQLLPLSIVLAFIIFCIWLFQEDGYENNNQETEKKRRKNKKRTIKEEKPIDTTTVSCMIEGYLRKQDRQKGIIEDEGEWHDF